MLSVRKNNVLLNNWPSKTSLISSNGSRGILLPPVLKVVLNSPSPVLRDILSNDVGLNEVELANTSKIFAVNVRLCKKQYE